MIGRVRRWHLTRPAWLATWADLFFILAVVGLAVLWSAAPPGAGHAEGVLRLLLVGGAAAAVVVQGLRRRTQPLVTLAVCLVASAVVTWAVAEPAWQFGAGFGVFCVAAYEDRTQVRRWVVGGMLVGFLGYWFALSGSWVADAMFLFVQVSLLGWARGIRTQRAYMESLVQRAQAAERERDVRAAQAVAAERARIARDIHDLVSHSLAVVAVQAAGAQRIAARDPQQAADTLGVIALTARDALAEMRAMLTVLRSGADADPDGRPSAGLAEIGELVSALADRGVAVELVTSGTPYPLGAGAELAVYRVVQEALTNAVKHGGMPVGHDPIRAELRYEPAELAVRITNQIAPNAADEVPGSGSGLAGMRERLELYGGTMRAVSRDGIFEVAAQVPRPA